MAEDFYTFYNWELTGPSRYHCRPIGPDYFDWLFSMLAGTGLTFLFRCNLAGRVYYRSRLMVPFDHGCVVHTNPDAAYWHRVAESMEGCDPLAEAVRAARRHGVPIWAWFNWNEFQSIREDWAEWVDPVWYERPRKYWCNRDGSRFYHGVPNFGDDEVRQRLIGLAAEVLGYGVDGIYLSSRSHSWKPCYLAPGCNDDLELFGFNDSVVDAYRKRYGVDIRREDYDHEQWLRIKGDQYSTLLARTGALVHQAGRRLVVGIVPDRYTLLGVNKRLPARQQLQLYKDWETWVAEGSIDGLCVEQNCPHEKTLAPANVAPLTETLPPSFPVYAWADTAWYTNRDGRPFSWNNWSRNSVRDVLGQIELARTAGASGIVLHSMYHYTASDTEGRPIGEYGVMPRTEYFDALRSKRP